MIQPTRFTKGQKVILRKIGKILIRFKTGQMKKKKALLINKSKNWSFETNTHLIKWKKEHQWNKF